MLSYHHDRGESLGECAALSALWKRANSFVLRCSGEAEVGSLRGVWSMSSREETGIAQVFDTWLYCNANAVLLTLRSS